MESRIRLLRIATIPLSLKLLLRGQLAALSERGFGVLAVSASGPEIVDGKVDGVPHRIVPMTRKITPFRDFVSLVRLIVLIVRFRPHIVHTHTPKAGLLGMVAAWLCGTPVRMHTVAGLPLMERSGFIRRVLIAVERITYRCATGVYPNSFGLKTYIENHIGRGFPVTVIGNGSSNGIDTRYFSRQPDLEISAAGIRHSHAIGNDDLVFCFVGRVVKDKGIRELLAAYRECRAKDKFAGKLFLIVVGPLEQDLDPLPHDDLQFLQTDPGIILAGYQSDVRPWIMASDIFVFPSYREGFPNVVMQASCLEVPCIVSDINGCNEIIDHERTGLIVKPKDIVTLAAAMERLAAGPAERKAFSLAARQKVVGEYDQAFVWSELEKIYHANLVRQSRNGFKAYRDLVKPALDTLVAFVILVLASPVMLLCVVLLAWANKGKVWFTQTRPGRNGRLFKVLKFRTMSDERDKSGELLPDDLRLHGIGKFIRRTSLDELPQLINVIMGHMSIVGPRPLLPEYLGLYSKQQMRRHEVKPGITGWAQVNGRNAISWKQKFEYDVWYVDHQTFWLDLKIILLTVVKVFKAEGISSTTSVTMEKFRGDS